MPDDKIVPYKCKHQFLLLVLEEAIEERRGKIFCGKLKDYRPPKVRGRKYKRG
jgi:hypothetical protein